MGCIGALGHLAEALQLLRKGMMASDNLNCYKCYPCPMQQGAAHTL